MPINFPSNPNASDTYTSAGTTWIYDGSVWNVIRSESVVNIPTVNTFQNVAVSGQSTVVAELASDTLNLVAGSNITLTTDASADSITIASTASGGSTTFNSLTDATSASITIDEIALPAITVLNVTNVGASAYLFDQYSGNNPTIYAIGGTTIAFKLNVSGHPFLIQNAIGNNYDTGLVHVSTTGSVLTGASAQGQVSGTLYWKVPATISGGYRYQCSVHGAMVGSITVKNIVSI